MRPERFPRPLLLSIAVAAGALFVGISRAQEFAPGTLVERVVCLNDAGQSYALYLPSSFDPARTWPVLFLFDSGARGPLAVAAFREAAETCGWILIGSNNSHNGPQRDNALAAQAVWADALTRLPIDVRRIYAAGFSGGARAASAFPQYVGRAIAGVVGCGAGIATGLDPGSLKAAAYFGLAGLADFNYGEMKGLDRALDPSGLPHAFYFFEGTHDWPDPSSCARAAGWMEVVAMQQGLRPKDPMLAGLLIGRELDEARTLENAGRIYWAGERLEAAALLTRGLELDLAGLEDLPSRVAGLKARKEYRRFLDAERARDREEAEFRTSFGQAFGAVEDPDTGGTSAVPKVLQEMRIGFLKKDAKNAKTIEERSLASRLLFEFSFAAQARAASLSDARDLSRAAAYWDLAIAACEEGLPRERGLYFNRACVAAISGDKKTALKSLSSAVDKGFADLELLESAGELDPIRDTAGFREILARIRAKISGNTQHF
jgi:predicted esterase